MKGLCEIQLIDNTTGEVVQTTRDENMVTNALNNLLNPPPIFFAESSSYEYYNYIHNFMKSIDQSLGGVMLWSEQIPEDVNTIYPPNPDAQVGYAGNNAYTGNNRFRGSYNASESGKTDTGYKFVWDFPTSQANGTIRCVTLTSGMGGRCGWGGSTDTEMLSLIGTMINIPNYRNDTADYVSAGNFIGMYKENICTFITQKDKELTLRDVEFPVYDLKTKSDTIFSNSVIRNFKNTSTVKLVSDFNWSPYTNNYARIRDCFVSCWSVDGINIDYIKVDGKTKTITTQKKIVLTGGRKCLVYSKFVERSGFLYVLSESRKILYKINLLNTAEIIDIKLPPFADSNISLNILNGMIIIKSRQEGYILNKNDEIIPSEFPYTLSDYEWSLNGELLNIKPPFTLLSYYSNSALVCPYIVYPYLATIDNLANPVTKTASQSMKVIYTLTDV